MLKTIPPDCRMLTRSIWLVLLVTVLVGAPSVAQESAQGVRANRELAMRFSQDKMDKMIFDTQVQPHWLEGSDRF